MISTSSFITLCLVVMYIIAFFLSLATIMLCIEEKFFETSKLHRLGYVILAFILTPLLWVYGVFLIIAYIFRQIRNEIER